MTDNEFHQYLLHGAVAPAKAPIIVQAGLWKAAYIEGDLRYICVNDQEAIRRVYGAIRDRNWNTIAGERTNEKIEINADSFRISYQSHHQQGDIDFVWQSKIVGESDGTITFEFDGVAQSDFYRNRIGYCVLHPSNCAAGGKAEAYYSDGNSASLVLPRYVAAKQPIPGFHDLVGLAHHVTDDLWCRLEFEGDLFETEDQRNWIDASFKTYSTPLSEPFPVLVEAGTRVQQKITLRLEKRDQSSSSDRLPLQILSKQPRTIQVKAEPGATTTNWPKIGCCLNDSAVVGDLGAIASLKRLKFDHVRIDVVIEEAFDRAKFREKLAIAKDLETSIELVIDLQNQTIDVQSRWLLAVSEELKQSKAEVARICVFGGENANVTSIEAVQMVRQHLQWIGAPIGGGSNTDLYQYNLKPIEDGIDFLCWGMNPQVHADDNWSLAETPDGARDQILGVRQKSRDRAVVVTPITLKPRFNPVATSEESANQANALPANVDARQMSLLGAAWSVGMLKAVAEAGCASATFYEAVGWRGFLVGDEGVKNSELFPSQAGAKFPIYHLFQYIGNLPRPVSVLESSSDDAGICSLHLKCDKAHHLIVANLSPNPQQVVIGPLRFEHRFVLDLEAALKLANGEDLADSEYSKQDGTELEVPPYGVVFLKTEN